MALVGVLARVRESEKQRIEEDLTHFPGVSTFDLDDESSRLGIIIESPSLEEAHAFLTGTIDRVGGVLGTWPVFGHAEPAEESEGVADATVWFEELN